MTCRRLERNHSFEWLEVAGPLPLARERGGRALLAAAVADATGGEGCQRQHEPCQEAQKNKPHRSF